MAAAAAATAAEEEVEDPGVPVVASLSDSTSDIGVTMMVGGRQGRSSELDLSGSATVAAITLRGEAPRMKMPPDFGGEGMETGAFCKGGDPSRIPTHESPSALLLGLQAGLLGGCLETGHFSFSAVSGVSD